MSYLEQYNQEQEQKEQRQAEMRQIFFDTSRPVLERLQAFENFGTFKDAGDTEKAKAIFLDETQNETLRAAAMQGLISVIGKDENLLEKVLAILANENSPVVLRNTAMVVLRGLRFSSLLFLNKKPQYLTVLRQLINSNLESLKMPAMEELAQRNDSILQEKLVQGLKTGSNEITSAENAIQLLSYDTHGSFHNLLLEIAENPPSKGALKEALRNLGTEPKAKDILIKTLEDNSEDPEIRHVSATSLVNLDKTKMESISKNLILDTGVNEELKTALLNTIIHVSQPGELEADKDFQAKVKEVAKESQSENFKKMYRLYETQRIQQPKKPVVIPEGIKVPEDKKDATRPGSFMRYLLPIFKSIRDLFGQKKDKEDKGVGV